jgi:predicted RNase H-like HicB family nuclease
MLTEYIQAAMERAKFEILADDGTFFGEIPGLLGVWANAENIESCRAELKSVLEEWIILGLRLGHSLPVIDDIDLTPVLEPILDDDNGV